MNYINTAQARLKKIIDVPKELLDLYTLLIFVKGKNTTLEDIHDAWSIWRNNTNPIHKSLRPFNELPFGIQELDREYAKAVIEVANILDTTECVE